MGNNYIILILSIIAGLSTLIGSIFVFFNKKSDRNIVIVLGISIGILIVLGLQELLHESYEILIENTNIIYTILLIVLFVIIGYFITHLLDKALHHDEDNLKHLGLITTIGVSMHKLPEGIALFIAGVSDIKIGIALCIAIMLHHIPEGMMISMPIYYATNNKFKAMTYAFCSGLTTVLGTVIGMLFLNNINPFVLGCLFAITIGIFIFIIIHELLPTALNYKKYKLLIYSMLVGISTMMIIHLFTH